MRNDVKDAKDTLQKIGDVWELIQANKFDYEVSVDKVLESKEIQASLKQASEAMLNFWDQVERLHKETGKYIILPMSSPKPSPVETLIFFSFY